MNEYEIDCIEKRMERERFQLDILREMLVDLPFEDVFKNFPVKEIMVKPEQIDRSFLETDTVDWLLNHYRRRNIGINDVDNVYLKVIRWLTQITPEQIMKMDRRDAFGILCCSVWIMTMTESYGEF